jgi:AcrR family transcriptional regulator
VTVASGQLRADARRNRQLILRAARRCFAERGTTVPLADIARAAGVGVATVHRHFGGRPGILDELAIAQARDLLAVSTRAAREADPGTALSTLLLGLFELRASDRTITDAMTRFGPARSGVDLDRFDAAVDLVLARARSAGVVSDDFDRRDVLSLTMMVGTVADAPDMAGSDAPQRAAAVLLRGVFRSAPSPTSERAIPDRASSASRIRTRT